MAFHNGVHQHGGLERSGFQQTGPRRVCAIDWGKHFQIHFQTCRCFWLLESELVLPGVEMPHH